MRLIAVQYNSHRPIIHKRNIHHCCKHAVMNLFWNICSFQLVQKLCIEVFGLQADMTGTQQTVLMCGRPSKVRPLSTNLVARHGCVEVWSIASAAVVKGELRDTKQPKAFLLNR